MKSNKKIIKYFISLFCMILLCSCNSYEKDDTPYVNSEHEEYEFVTKADKLDSVIGGITDDKTRYVNYHFDLQFKLPPGWQFTTDLDGLSANEFIKPDKVSDQLMSGHQYYTMAARGNDARVVCIIQNLGVNEDTKNYSTEDVLNYYKSVFDIVFGNYYGYGVIKSATFAGVDRSYVYYGIGKLAEIEIFPMREGDLVFTVLMISSDKVPIDQVHNLFEYFDEDERL